MSYPGTHAERGENTARVAAVSGWQRQRMLWTGNTAHTVHGRAMRWNSALGLQMIAPPAAENKRIGIKSLGPHRHREQYHPAAPEMGPDLRHCGSTTRKRHQSLAEWQRGRKERQRLSLPHRSPPEARASAPRPRKRTLQTRPASAIQMYAHRQQPHLPPANHTHMQTHTHHTQQCKCTADGTSGLIIEANRDPAAVATVASQPSFLWYMRLLSVSPSRPPARTSGCCPPRRRRYRRCT